MQQGKTQATKLCMTQMEIELHCYSSKFRQGSPAKPTFQKSEQLAGATCLKDNPISKQKITTSKYS